MLNIVVGDILTTSGSIGSHVPTFEGAVATHNHQRLLWQLEQKTKLVFFWHILMGKHETDQQEGIHWLVRRFSVAG